MQKTAALPATTEAIELLTCALTQGHAITLSLATAPCVIRAPPLVTTCCLTFELTPSQARVLLALVEHGFVSKPDLHAAMSDGRGTSKVKTVDVVVCKVRQKLAEDGVVIETVWGSGYKINEDARNKLRKLITEYDAVNSKAEATESNMKST